MFACVAMVRGGTTVFVHVSKWKCWILKDPFWVSSNIVRWKTGLDQPMNGSVPTRWHHTHGLWFNWMEFNATIAKKNEALVLSWARHQDVSISEREGLCKSDVGRVTSTSSITGSAFHTSAVVSRWPHPSPLVCLPTDDLRSFMRHSMWKSKCQSETGRKSVSQSKPLEYFTLTHQTL